MKKLTPILIVEAIEPCLELWVDRLGLKLVAEVRDGDRLGFVILAGHGLELMLETRSALDVEISRDGLPPGMRREPGHGVLYADVDDVQTLRDRLEGLDVIVPSRQTDYGALELWMRDPSGNLIGFAEKRGAQ